MPAGLDGSYEALLLAYKPGPVHDEAEYERLLEVIEALYARRDESADLARFLELVTLLVHDYESTAHALPELPPIELLRVLMTERGLEQKDMVGVFKTESIVSKVLKGKRELTREHIERLAKKFAVSPGVFFRTRMAIRA